MEHWQFLIQKQGDRSWHTLESPNIQILEGRYRVLARSNLPNTDVEVRVTHSSTQEVPPKRRIQKQSRRTNSEGLMAVIPFTHFKAGIWEVRCSGDLMSDILGKSWQYSIHLQVLSQLPNRDAEQSTGGGDVELNSLDFFMIPLPTQRSSHEPESIAGRSLVADLRTDIVVSTRTETKTHSNLVTSDLPDELALIANDHTTISTTEEITDSDAVPSELSSEELSLTSDRTIFAATENRDAVPSELPSEELSLTSDRTISAATEDSDAVPSELSSEELSLTGDRTISAATEDSDTVPSELSSEELSLTGDRTIFAATEDEDSDAVSRELPDEQEEYAIIDQPVSPVWLKGETAEQILQNLMELALPSTELLLDDDEFEEDPIIQPAPPLLLTLQQENYIARWGQGLSINAKVELQNTSLEDEPEYATSLHALEVRIELRSPLSSEVLTQVRQPLAENLLPLTISSAINIPVDCDSKLLLGELSLYGALTDFGEVMLLASRSFTVTADVTELLAITAVGKSSQQSFLENSGLSSISAPNQESQASVSLGLELFNLVKASPNQLQTILPSPNQPLPPQINLLSLKKTGDLRSPQLPKLPEIQISAIAIDGVIAEPPAQQEEEFEENAEVVTTPTTIPLAPINLEQLAIKNRRRLILGNTFPYLKRLETLPVDEAEVPTHVVDEPDIPVTEDSPQLASNVELANNLADESDILPTENSLQFTPTDAEHDNLVSEIELPNDSGSEVLASGNSEVVAESLPEEADTLSVEFSDPPITKLNIPLNPEILAESLPEVADTPSLEFSDLPITQSTVPLNSQLIAEGNPYSSPLIRKWMQSQGYFVPEPPPPPPVQYQSQEIEVAEPQNTSVEEEPPEPNLEISPVDTDLWAELDTELDALDVKSEANIETESSLSEENLSSEVWEDTAIGSITEDAEDLKITPETDTEDIPQDVSTPSLQIPQLALSQKIKIPRAWLAQEIVVDDTCSDSEEISTKSIAVERKPQSNSSVSSSPAMEGEINEPLPTPQLHIPEGELVAGQSVRVRVALPEVPPQVVVKLWIEDCQTRGLLDGPHLLKDLLPNLMGGVEVMTQINVPFGCVEIRLEAIAFNTSTEQESHKVTVVRTVIPPDLPNLQVDELLGL